MTFINDRFSSSSSYTIQWYGGDLGLALIALPEQNGVIINRITGKGNPVGMEHVLIGDHLLSINEVNMRQKTLEEVVAELKTCTLPAAIQFEHSIDEEKENDLRFSEINLRGSGITSPESSPRMLRYTSFAKTNLGGRRRSSIGAAMLRNTYIQSDSVENNTTFRSRRNSGLRYTLSAIEETGSPQLRDITHRYSAPTCRKTEPILQWKNSDPGQLETTLNEMKDETIVDDNETVVTSESENQETMDNTKKEISSSFESYFDQGKEEENQEESSRKDNDSMDSENNLTPSDEAICKQQESIEAIDKTPESIQSISSETEREAVHDSIKYNSLAKHKLNNEENQDSTRHNSLTKHKLEESVDSDSILRAAANHAIKRRLSREKKSTTSATSETQGKLHLAAASGNLDQFINILKHKNIPDEFKESVQQDYDDTLRVLFRQNIVSEETPLHIAVRSGNLHIVNLICKYYTHINEIIDLQNVSGDTALHLAVQSSPHMVYLLLKQNANCRICNLQGSFPLTEAIVSSKIDDPQIVRLLLHKGNANPNVVYHGLTALHLALDRQKYNISASLIKYGAGMDIEDSDGCNAFEKTNGKILRVLLTHINYPPSFILLQDRAHCMLCRDKLSALVRRPRNCTHCGRICCKECTSYNIPYYQFPQGFPGRLRGGGTAVRTKKSVCKTCYHILHKRYETDETKKPSVVGGIIREEWVEMGPPRIVP